MCASPPAPREGKPEGTSEADEPSYPSVTTSEDGSGVGVGGAERDRRDRRGSLSPLELSRISSPSRGMTLAEMTRVTPEDQERWRQSLESLEKGRSRESLMEIAGQGTLPPRDRFGGSLEIRSTYHHAREGSRAEASSPSQQEKVAGDERCNTLSLPVKTSPPQKPRKGSESGSHEPSQLESSSDTTLVGSQSQSDTGMGPVPDEGGGHVHLQPVSSKKSRRSPRGKKSPKQSGKKGKNTPDSSNKTSATLSVNYTHVSV